MEQQFVTVFQAFVVVHQRLNEQAAEKAQIIKNGDIKALDELIKKETPLIHQLRKLENTRQQLVSNWLNERGIIADDVTMQTIIPTFSDETQKKLNRLQEQLVVEITTLKEQNEVNRSLLEDSLKFVNLSLDTFQPQNQFNDYSNGQAGDDDGPETGRSLFDSKA
ncbi:flagellar protein FlgN [Paenalkalicoccus suaedae]|uniref:Flagellar protein FlgN n=1 Tax=Paenalkalicoccus suaedae TaxID=2592382 RepID=A0A859FGV2_9BACI|nr:flagellar protein FlgN [Paenalkalicoccus suaedae]QKS72359.1 flagellar protein FlgN [Paenalkalicoccus suaedae]